MDDYDRTAIHEVNIIAESTLQHSFREAAGSLPLVETPSQSKLACSTLKPKD